MSNFQSYIDDRVKWASTRATCEERDQSLTRLYWDLRMIWSYLMMSGGDPAADDINGHMERVLFLKDYNQPGNIRCPHCGSDVGLLGVSDSGLHAAWDYEPHERSL